MRGKVAELCIAHALNSFYPCWLLLTYFYLLIFTTFFARKIWNNDTQYQKTFKFLFYNTMYTNND